MKGLPLWRLGLRGQPPFRPRASQPCPFARRPRLLPLSLASSISSSAFQYELIELVEDLEKYQLGGYHPVCVDDRLHNRYRVVHKLGHGTFSTVWLAHDQQTQQYVAVKVGIAHVPSRETDTLKYLTEVNNASSQPSIGAAMIPMVKDYFTISGPNGNHPCLVTSPARGSLSDSKQEGGQGTIPARCFPLTSSPAYPSSVLRSFSRILPWRYVSKPRHYISIICLGTLTNSVEIYSLGHQLTCHIYLHLGNLLLQLLSSMNDLTVDELYSKVAAPMPQPVVRIDNQPYSVKPGVPSHVNLPVWLGEEDGDITSNEAKLLLSDFGTAFRPSDNNAFKSQTPLVIRPPEVLLEPGMPLSFGSDIWSLGCIIFELFSHTSLFDGLVTPQDGITAQ